MSFEKVLLIDEDKNIYDLLRTSLEGCKIMISHEKEDALKKFNTWKPDIILMDVAFSKIEGWQICRKIREKSNIPLLIITSKNEIVDKLLGFELGADDYILKPFDTRELLARMKAVYRRSSKSDHPERREVIYDNIVINMEKRELIINGKVKNTPPKELELLFYLASNPNRVYTRDQLLDEVWGFEYYGDSRTIDVHIKRLRKKIEGASSTWSLKTVWGVGYKFEMTESEEINADIL